MQEIEDQLNRLVQTHSGGDVAAVTTEVELVFRSYGFTADAHESRRLAEGISGGQRIKLNTDFTL